MKTSIFRVVMMFSIFLASITFSACGGGGGGDTSTPTTPTTPTTPPDTPPVLKAPSAPTNVVATAQDGQATITFDAPADNGNSPITGYTIMIYPDNRSCACSGSPHVVTGLDNGKAYTFTVVANNSAGSSALSSASNQVTPQNVDPKWTLRGNVAYITARDASNVQYAAIERDNQILVAKLQDGFRVWEQVYLTGPNYHAEFMASSDEYLFLVVTEGNTGKGTTGAVIVMTINNQDKRQLTRTNIPTYSDFKDAIFDPYFMRLYILYNRTLQQEITYVVSTFQYFDRHGNSKTYTLNERWGDELCALALDENYVYAIGKKNNWYNNDSSLVMFRMDKALTTPGEALQRPTPSTQPAIYHKDLGYDLILNTATQMFTITGSFQLDNGTYVSKVLETKNDVDGWIDRLVMPGQIVLKNLIYDASGNILAIKHDPAGNDALMKFKDGQLTQIAVLGAFVDTMVVDKDLIFITYDTTKTDPLYLYPVTTYSVLNAQTGMPVN